MRAAVRMCGHCAQITAHTQQQRNHVGHALIAILTGGVWLLGWVVLAWKPLPWQCEECGRPRNAQLEAYERRAIAERSK
jgi:hypothetical protein